jgi:hypothetical protein
MQDDKLDSEKQPLQTVCQDKHKENSWKNILEKIKNHPITQVLYVIIVGIVLIILFKMFLIIIPSLAVHDAMSRYENNSTLAGMHVATETNLLIFFVTLAYVILTLILVTETKKTVIQSKKEQQIRDIENRLEKFYIPADDIMNNQLNNIKYTILNGHISSPTGVVPSEIGLKQINQYNYLADKKTYKAYDIYFKTGCTTAKNDTCKLNNVFNKCNHKNDTFTGELETGEPLIMEYSLKYCKYRDLKCPYNLNYCEYNPECEKYQPDKVKKDTTYLNCTSDNTKCKYYIELKEKITTDIENYKEELLRLKT